MLKFLDTLGRLGYFQAQHLVHGHRLWGRGAVFAQQLDRLGLGSLPLLLVVGVFAGGIMAWQAAYQFQGLAPEHLIGGQTAKVVVMEAGPILAGLVLAGRCGAALAAEMGLMANTRQLDALRVMNLSPLVLLSLPRVAALVAAAPVLSVFTNLAGLVGAYGVLAFHTGLSLPEFLLAAQDSLLPREVWGGIAKSAVFGFLIGTIGCHFGLETQGGSAATARQTVRAFVWAAVAVLLADYLLWSILF